MGQLRIQLLGGFLLEWEGSSLPPIASKAGRSLFAYLVTNRDRAPTRDLLAGLFWPDQPESRARRRLSQALWQIQSVLSEIPTQDPYLVVTPSTVAFNNKAACWIDIDELERGLAGSGTRGADSRYQELERAVRLYRGDFLAGYYDDWVLPEQRRIRNQYLAGVEELLQLAKSRAQFGEALAFAHRLALHDPLREEAHQEVMRIAFLIGRSSEAIQQYERLRSILDEELGVDPSETTEQLYREIVTRTERGTRPFTPAPNSPLFDAAAIPFVGRDAQRSTVLSRMEEAMAGAGGLVLLEGDSGVGKTRLLAQLADDAHWRGLGVLWGTCSSTAGPFEVVRSALADELSPLRVRQLGQQVEAVWLREAAELLPQVSDALPDLPDRVRLQPQEERTRTTEALAEILLGLGRINPYLVVMDDLHEADLDSLRLVEGLTARLRDSAVLLCLSFRSEDARERREVWDSLRAMDAHGISHRIVLTPLSEGETIELVRRSLGVSTVSEEASQLLYKDTGGNPLFTLETLRALHDLETTDAAAYLAGHGPLPIRDQLPIAGTVQELVSKRLSALPGSVSEVLDAAAVHGDRPSLEVLSAMPGLRSADLLAAVDHLIRRGLMREAGGHVEFAHGQVRRVAYRLVDDDDTRDLHVQVGEALERTGLGTPSERAHHFERGGDYQRGLRYHKEAGSRAVGVHAYETAAVHYQTAVALTEVAGISSEDRFALLAEFEDVLDVLGRRKGQALVLDELQNLATLDPRRRADVLLRQARAAGAGGDLDVATRHSRSALAQAEAAGLGSEAARALVSLGTFLVWSGKAAEAVPVLERAVAASSTATARGEANHRLASAFVELQQYGPAEVALTEARHDADSGGDLRGRAAVLGTLAIVKAETGSVDEAEAAYREALTLSREIGHRRGEGVNLVNLASLLYFRGRTGEALAGYDAAAAIFRQLGERRGEAMVLANSASVRVGALGDADGARRAEQARAYFREAGDAVREAQCLGVLALAARLAGDVEAAESLVAEGLALAEGVDNQWIAVQLQKTGARLDLDRGDAEHATALARRAAATAEQHDMSDIAVGLLAIEAEGLLALGRLDEAQRTVERAVASLGPGVEQPQLVWLAAARVREATGDPPGATVAFEQAKLQLDRLLEGLDADQATQARSVVPEHRAIMEHWDRVKPQSRQWRLARMDAPTGRALRDEDFTTVTWTLPSDRWQADPAVRRELLMSLLDQASHQGASATVDDLARALDVSGATVRRDLVQLRASGRHPRTRGSRE